MNGWPSTTESTTSSAAISARDAYRREPLRPARPGEHPDGDLACGPHVRRESAVIGSLTRCWARRRHRRRPMCRSSRRTCGAPYRRPCALGWRRTGTVPRVRVSCPDGSPGLRVGALRPGREIRATDGGAVIDANITLGGQAIDSPKAFARRCSGRATRWSGR